MGALYNTWDDLGIYPIFEEEGVAVNVYKVFFGGVGQRAAKNDSASLDEVNDPNFQLRLPSFKIPQSSFSGVGDFCKAMSQILAIEC